MSDKTLFEIIEAVKTNQPVDEQDLRYALLAESYLANMANSLLLRLYQKDKPPLFDMLIANNHKANNTSLNKPPKEWLGWDNDPDNPAYQRFHLIGSALVDKVLKGELHTNKPAEAEVPE